MSTIEAFKMIENKDANKCVEKNEPTNCFCIKQIIEFVYQGQKVHVFRPSYIIYGDRTIIAIIICDVRRRIRH
jgi:hypothetical protein